MNRILFLSACIAPGNMYFTKLTDVAIRQKQYIAALQWYLNNTNFKILFVENTNCDLSEYFVNEIKNGRLEMLTFNGNNYDIKRGKGYGEALILEYGLNHSALLKQASSFVKITGRLICTNINLLTKCCGKDNVLYARIVRDEQKKLTCDSRLFISSLDFLRIFLSKKESLNDSNHFYFEHLLFNVRSLWISGKKKATEPWLPMNIIGESGSTGSVYNELSIIDILKFYCKRVLHCVHYYV